MRQGGFTLIEVLVALFILSVGLLGTAKLQHINWKLIVQPDVSYVDII